MNFEAALEQELAVGALAGKVFPLTAPEGTKAPYLAYLSSDGAPEKALSGFLGTKEVSFELNVIHATYTSMKALSATVLATLRSFEQRTIGTSGPFIQDLVYDEPVELYEPLVKQYRCNINIRVYF